jgi:hypothetical protein
VGHLVSLEESPCPYLANDPEFGIFGAGLVAISSVILPSVLLV